WVEVPERVAQGGHDEPLGVPLFVQDFGKVLGENPAAQFEERRRVSGREPGAVAPVPARESRLPVRAGRVGHLLDRPPEHTGNGDDGEFAAQNAVLPAIPAYRLPAALALVHRKVLPAKNAESAPGSVPRALKDSKHDGRPPVPFSE